MLSDAANHSIYDTRYSDAHFTHAASSAYDRKLIALRFRILEPLCHDARIADFGCGTGSYLLPLARHAREAIGVDYSTSLLHECEAKRVATARTNVRLLAENIEHTSLPATSMNTVFSIATLYCCANIDVILAEMARVLVPGGAAVFELGNRWSLNTIANRFHPYGIAVNHVSVHAMDRMVRDAGFIVRERRVFQIFPLWGHPRFLWPVTMSLWKVPFGWSVRGRMLDEIVSSAPILRAVAFRHLFVCQKA